MPINKDEAPDSVTTPMSFESAALSRGRPYRLLPLYAAGFVTAFATAIRAHEFRQVFVAGPARQGREGGGFAAGGYPLEFATISGSEGISLGHEGMHFSLPSRELIADGVDSVMQAERFDGAVLLAGCGKSLPGMLMAAVRGWIWRAYSFMPERFSPVPRMPDGSELVNIVDAFRGGRCMRPRGPRPVGIVMARIWHHAGMRQSRGLASDEAVC